ncbi:MAG TPA: DUF2251 domain-containing protein [Pyrinomonadaceae bacterium]|nr:DUF2251 domain-containing protein [Pyrinomonadaceae bacterium]
MPSTIVLEETFQVGEEKVLPGDSPQAPHGVVFEDDGDTGYFYALDFEGDDDYTIVDALNIYNAKSVVDKAKPSVLQIWWTDDGLKAALVINNYPHAVFDFETKQAYSRTNFPRPISTWVHQEWRDSALEPFDYESWS